ncbi:iron complex transport system ATP-binding protein [Cohaesibacter sp. ES.047]|uniref:ABC transporter ATP-binding protein n=1 Tax=Cohaesibacter sp. ES.047 TaxID=1798205 RepID=UPI000BB795BB|nr:ABC transporter ATP-binding protein [Cohaesibacter sp. ES.047]SNY91039.1 iron complex transport system ATP-binding protein [Cohaesibacter sp. ES.047]
MISARNLHFSRDGHVILDDVDLDVPDGETVGLVGPNGSGKTTLLRLLYGASAPDEGTIRLDGTDITEFRQRQLARRIAVVPQERPTTYSQTLADMVMLGRMPHQGLISSHTKSDYKAVIDALDEVGLLPLAERHINSLSGGEMQRALIARALCQQTDHLLLDEPTNHLDLRYQLDVLAMIRNLEGTKVVVLHDLNLAARFCDRIAVMANGRIVASGKPDQVLHGDLIQSVYQVSMVRLRAPGGQVHLSFDRLSQAAPKTELHS